MSFRRGVAASEPRPAPEAVAAPPSSGTAPAGLHSESNTAPGIRPSLRNGASLMSSGISRLDEILDGGVPVGGMVVLLDDAPRGQYASIMCQYALSEGVACGHTVALPADDRSLLDSAPGIRAAGPDEEAPMSAEQLRIAWRYTSTPTSQPSASHAASFAHQFDLGDRLAKSTLEAASIAVLPAAGCSYHTLLDACAAVVRDATRPVRLVLCGIGSPRWRADDPQDAHRFLLSLRALLRREGARASAWITVPPYALSHSLTESALLRAADVALRLQAFADDETHPAFKQHHGLIDFLRLPSLAGGARGAAPQTLRWTFKLKRRGFTIEMLHLPPELEDSAQRIPSALAAPPAAGAKQTVGASASSAAPPSQRTVVRQRAAGAGCASSQSASPLDF